MLKNKSQWKLENDKKQLVMKIFKFIEEWQKISKHQSEKLTIAKEMDTHLQWRNNKDKIKNMKQKHIWYEQN